MADGTVLVVAHRLSTIQHADNIIVFNDGEIAENTSYTINQEVINEEEKYDGYYALTTNLVGDISEIFKIVKNVCIYITCCIDTSYSIRSW